MPIDRSSDGDSAGFLGTGWSFPPSFGPQGAEVAMVSGAEDVHQSLRTLLLTRLGERTMRSDFGCDLHGVVFEELDQSLINRIDALVRGAIGRHERRVEVLGVDVARDEQDPSLLRIRVTYEVLGTNSRYNMVYPFFLNEGLAVGL